MNLLFTICARANSKGIKDKNISDFLGKPLSCYTFSVLDLFLKKNPVNADIVVNTDSQDLIDLILTRIKIPVEIIKRKVEIAQDDTPKLAVIRDCFLQMKQRKNVNYEMVIDLDLTSPLRTLADLENLIAEKEKNENEVIFSVTESRRNPYFNMVKKENSHYLRVIPTNFSARQQAPAIFDMNASLYAYSAVFLASEKEIFETTCGVIKMRDTGILDLDRPEDLELMQAVAQFLFNKYEEFGEIKKNIDNILEREIERERERIE